MTRAHAGILQRIRNAYGNISFKRMAGGNPEDLAQAEELAEQANTAWLEGRMDEAKRLVVRANTATERVRITETRPVPVPAATEPVDDWPDPASV